MTPYFLPDDRIITALALAAMRGVGVDIVLPARTNHPSWTGRCAPTSGRCSPRLPHLAARRRRSTIPS